MPRLSASKYALRAHYVVEYRRKVPHATPAMVARATGLPYHWVYHFMMQCDKGIQSMAHVMHGRRARSYEENWRGSPMTNLLIQSLKDNPPKTQREAWERIQEAGMRCGTYMVPKYLKRWGLPVPAATRGATAVNKRPNKKFEELKSAVRVLCMQHPDAVPTALIEELLDGQ